MMPRCHPLAVFSLKPSALLCSSLVAVLAATVVSAHADMDPYDPAYAELYNPEQQRSNAPTQHASTADHDEGTTERTVATEAAASTPTITNPPVAPMELDYTVRSQGVPFSVTATRTLIQRSDGQWHMDVRARNLIGEIRERTWFNWHGCVPRSDRYRYLRRGFGRVREAQVDFDRDTNLAYSDRSHRDNRDYEFPDDTTDELGVSLWLQCELQQGNRDITVTVGDTRRLEAQRYQVVEEEAIEVAGKQVNTLKVQRDRDDDSSRETYLWFAPAYDYTLVRLLQIEDGSEHSMELQSF